MSSPVSDYLTSQGLPHFLFESVRGECLRVRPIGKRKIARDLSPTGRIGKGVIGMSEEKICAGCGIEYQPKKGQASWRKYCSRACQNKSYNAKRYVGNAPEICPECGDKIEQEEQKGRYRRYCSDQCRIKYNAR